MPETWWGWLIALVVTLVVLGIVGFVGSAMIAGIKDANADRAAERMAKRARERGE